MPFQLVLATDDEITIWHTEHGHIFGFMVDTPRRELLPRFTRDAPDAPVEAATVQDDAHRFALEQARIRHLVI